MFDLVTMSADAIKDSHDVADMWEGTQYADIIRQKQEEIAKSAKYGDRVLINKLIKELTSFVNKAREEYNG